MSIDYNMDVISKKAAINQDCTSLSTYSVEASCATTPSTPSCVRPTSNIASHFYHDKSDTRISMGKRLRYRPFRPVELHYYHVANLERKENQGLKKTNAVSFDIADKTAPSSLVYLQLS